MPRFTFILEYDGGTYLSQVKAASFRAAPAVWTQHHMPSPLPGIGPSSMSKLANELREAKPAPLDGVHATWCITAMARGKLVLVHFVQTIE